MNDPAPRRVGRVAELPHAEKGNVRELHVLVRVSDAEQLPHRLAPELGEHTDELLAELGCSEEEIAALRAAARCGERTERGLQRVDTPRGQGSDMGVDKFRYDGKRTLVVGGAVGHGRGDREVGRRARR